MLLGVIVRVKGAPKRHKPLSQRPVSPPAKKRSSNSSVSESLPSTTQSPLRHSPVADIEDIVFQYNSNQIKKSASQATSSPSATTPPSSQSTPSFGTPSMSSGTVNSPIPSSTASKPSSSLASLEAQRQQLLELQERARQQMLQSQYRGSTSQNSNLPSNVVVSLSQLPQTFVPSQSTLSLTTNNTEATQLPAMHSSQITLPSAQVIVPSSADDAPYDPEEDLDLALEDALAKENDQKKDEQLTSGVPVVTDTGTSVASSVTVSLPKSDGSLPSLQATLHALGIPAIAQGITTPKKLSEQGEKKEVEENIVSSRTDSQLGGQPTEKCKEMQSVPQTSSSSHHQFTAPPSASLQTSSIRQNLPGSGSFRMDNCLAETRQPKEEHASRGLPTSKEHQHHEVCSRDDHPSTENPHHEVRSRVDHPSTGNPQGRNDIELQPQHSAGKSHTDRLDSRHPHDTRPRDPGSSWRDSRGPRDLRFPHETRYNRDRDSHDVGFTRDRYGGRHDEGQYRDYSDRYRGRDDYGHQFGYPRGDQQRRRSWEDGRYEGYRREKWRR